jgi:hypothetical protein
LPDLRVISEGLHRTLMVAPLEAAKVSDARQWFSYLTVTSIAAAASLRARFRWRLRRYEVHRVLDHPPVARVDGFQRVEVERGTSTDKDHGSRMTGWSATEV